jgi:pilus assembly protein Flp/PilA
MLNSLKERGQGLVEYGLILVLVAVAVVAALTILGPTVGNLFSRVNNSLPK